MKLFRLLMVVVATGTFSFALSPAPARARTLDRRGVVRAALAQNPQIASARAEEAVVEAQRSQVDAARWPMVSVQAGIAPSWRATLVPGTAVQSVESQYKDFKLGELSAAFLGNLTVIQPITTFGKIAHRQEATDHGLRARQAQTRMQGADVAFEAARIYEGYLLATDLERFLDETLHWLDSTRQATEEKLEQGVAKVKEGDVLRLQTAVGIATIGLHQARAGRAQAKAGLIAYLNLPRGEEITTVEGDLEAVGQVPADFEALVKLAYENRPELTALNEGQRALHSLERAEAAGFAPDLFAAAFVESIYTPGRDWIQSRFVVDPLNHFVPGALVGLRWQFQGNMAQARAREQAARAQVLAHLGTWAGAGIPAEVRRAYEDVVRNRKAIDDGSQAVSKAKQWMVQSSADYTVGFQDVREVSDAVSAYVTLRGLVMQARFEHNVAMAALSRATGALDGDNHLFYLADAPSPPAGSGAPTGGGAAHDRSKP